jgi:peptidoglycan/xylan/chitin deacetylase (PgdA/CDA1 family)
MGKPIGHFGRGRVKLSVLALAALAFATLPPATVVTRGNPHLRQVALTFDAGADRGYAVTILKILERDHIHGSFGMTGTWAMANPDLVRRMARDGDTLINHTYDHRSFTGYSTQTAPLTTRQRTWEIQQTEQAVWKIAHRSTKPYFRPPFGDYDAATVDQLRRLGYRYMVMWSVDSLGWERISATAILQRCLTLLQPGDIYLMHVGIQSQDAIALPSLIASLKSRGYRFVTVTQLIKRI